MAYIGAVAPGYDPTRASVPQLDAERFSGNASTTAFTLARQVVSPTDIDVVVENVTQEPTVAYSVNGNTLTFTEAPGTGTNNIYVVYRGSGISNYAFVPDGSITYAKLANNIKQFTVDAVTANGTGTTVELTEAPASANSIIVSVDGVIQTAPTNYTLSGSTITFTGVPDNGANVVVRHIGFRTTSTVTALQASSVTATEIADGSITNVKIVSVANTKISGNIVSSQITSVANTQITGTITGSQISSNTLSNTVFQTGSVENYMSAAGLGFGMRNRIINGAMGIWQRATTQTFTNSLVYGSVDRWVFIQGGGSASISQTQSTVVPTGFQYAIKQQRTAASTTTGTVYSVQEIETVNCYDLAGQAVTLSFWAKCGANFSASGSTLTSLIYQGTGTDQGTTSWISGTWTSPTSNTQSNTLTTSYQKFTQTVTLGASTTELVIALQWDPVGTAGADDSVFITGVQLEKGSTATSFDYRPYGTELVLCQRYCYIISGNSKLIGTGYNRATTRCDFFTTLPVTMRASPTATVTSGTNYYYVDYSQAATNMNDFSVNITTTQNAIFLNSGLSGLTAGSGNSVLTQNASAFVSFSAEL